MLKLFPVAMLAAYKAYGEGRLGMEIKPLHLYDWKIEHPEDGTTVETHAIWDCIAGKPLTNWAPFDLTVALVIKECGLDALFIGGGSGRFATAMEAWGQKCHSIDASDAAIELMGLRGVSCEKMDGHDMRFSDGSYELVVISDSALLTSDDPVGLLTEAARVASSRLIVGGWEFGDRPIDIRETMTWQGQTETVVCHRYPPADIVRILESAGMTERRLTRFLSRSDRSDISWVIEVGK